MASMLVWLFITVIWPTAAIPDYDLSNLASTQGFRMASRGSSVSAAGDLNGDGVGDLVIGAYWVNANTGMAYVIFGKRNTSNLDVDLAAFITGPTTGFRILAAVADDKNGYSVSKAGDVNNDCVDDVIIGAYGGDPDGTRFNAGISYVIFGRIVTAAAGNAFGDIQLPTAAMTASVGFRILGAATGDQSGWSVSGAGDVNGDGISDVIVGAFTADTEFENNAGISYVVFGKNMTGSALPFGDVDLSLVVSGSPIGFRILGSAAGDWCGYSLRYAGDINGDGNSDIIVGSINVNAASGASYIIFGRVVTVAAANAFADIQLPPATAMSINIGFRVLGAAAGDQSGYSVSYAGDVNADGVDDVIIGAINADPPALGVNSNAGISYVVFGRNVSGGAAPFADVQLSSIVTGSLIGFRILGAVAADLSGVSVSTARDINDDGVDDVIIGALNADPYGSKTNGGISYIVYGRVHKAGETVFGDVNLASLASDGFRILGSVTGEQSGGCVSSAGDVNGDTVNDIVVGTELGSSYVIYGTPGSPTSQPSSQPSRQPSAQPTHQPSALPSVQPSRQPSVQPVGVPSTYPTTQPSSNPTSQPTSQPSNQPTQQPSMLPTMQPSTQPTSKPSAQPSAQSACFPTSQPSKQPSNAPSCQPYVQPSSQPSLQPSYQPSARPSVQPTRQPNAQPSSAPSKQPTTQPSTLPTCYPSSQPTTQPSGQPSNYLSYQPSACPSSQPSEQPSGVPSSQPSTQPSAQPSTQSSKMPSTQPSSSPSTLPSTQPSTQPSKVPSAQPSTQPSIEPTKQPSTEPTLQPTVQPSAQPSTQPSAQPSSQPSSRPGLQPSLQPSSHPSSQPSTQPSVHLSVVPSSQPSTQPSHQSTTQPSSQPRGTPTGQPTLQPTLSPAVGKPFGFWSTTINSVQRIGELAVINSSIWACGMSTNTALCMVLESISGLAVDSYYLPWADVTTVSQTMNASHVLVSGRSVAQNAPTISHLAQCTLLATQQICVGISYLDANFTAGTYVSFPNKMVYIGTYNLFTSATIIDVESGVASSYTYMFKALKSIALLHAHSPPNYVGAFVVGTGVSLSGAVNYIVTGIVRTDSGSLTAMYFAPISNSILNSAELVNTMALEYEHPDTFIAGGFELSDGVGMHAYVMRVNAFFGSVRYVIRYRVGDPSIRRALSDEPSISSVTRGIVRIDTTLYMIVDVYRNSNNNDFNHTRMTVLKVDTQTGQIFQQVQLSSPNASLSCTAISSSPTATFVYVACSIQHNTSTPEFVILATDVDLQFAKLPEGFTSQQVNLFRAENVLFKGTAVAITTKRTSIVTERFTFSPFDGTPTFRPTLQPTLSPSVQPSSAPSGQPSSSPTAAPSVSPQPTSHPSSSGPTYTYKPTMKPTPRPSAVPSIRPTLSPTVKPTNTPTTLPTCTPSLSPSYQPSVYPTTAPSQTPTIKPSRKPTAAPSARPTSAPSSAESVLLPAVVTSKSGQSSSSAVLIFVYVVAGLTGVWCIYQLCKCYTQSVNSYKKKINLHAELNIIRRSVVGEPLHRPQIANAPRPLGAHAVGALNDTHASSVLVGAHANSAPMVPHFVGSDRSSSVVLSSLHSSEMSDVSYSAYTDEPHSDGWASQSGQTQSRESTMEEVGGNSSSDARDSAESSVEDYEVSGSAGESSEPDQSEGTSDGGTNHGSIGHEADSDCSDFI